MERRLAAILLTDMVGYSRLMGLDEEGTIVRQKAHLNGVFYPTIADHSGRIVKATGDGLLVEFPSVVEAVKCAVHVQTELAGCDSEAPADQSILYRIGINVGDIVIDGDDILGDGVNVAARLEALAKPGGVCISGAVHDQIAGKTNFIFVDAGEQRVKNVPRPVRVWNWQADQTTESTEAIEELPPIPDKPSIAVLPFTNMSGDAEQGFFTDGVTEDIITILSKVPHLFVISRSSSFAFKKQKLDVSKVNQHLGVRYVLDGSVRKAGNRVRVTAQLFDSEGGGHIWADRYDRDLQDIFAIQDDITTEIVTALEVKLSQGEQVRIWRRHAGDFTAYEHFATGRDLYMQFKREANAEALPHLYKALQINPDFCSALAFVAWTLNSQVNYRWCDDKEATAKAAREYAERAIAADPESGSGYAALSSVARSEKDFDAALDNARQAVACNPNAADSHQNLALSHNAKSEWKEAKRAAEWALRVDPLVPDNSLIELARAQFHLAEYQGCLESASRILRRKPNWLTARIFKIAAEMRLGQSADASNGVTEVMRISPRFSVMRFGSYLQYQSKTDREAVLDTLRDAGLPE